jgi:hypothetical protein
MKYLLFLLFPLSVAIAGQDVDCIPKYEQRIEQAQEWGRLTYKWPGQIRKRQNQASAMIALIKQARAATLAKFAGGRELSELTFRTNRYRLDHKRLSILEVAEHVRQLEQSEQMCPDFSRLMEMSDVVKSMP